MRSTPYPSIFLILTLTGFLLGVSGTPNAVGAEPESEAYWRELSETSDQLLREQSLKEGLAANGVECRLVLDATGWRRGAPVKERTRFLVSRIEQWGLPSRVGLEYRGYIYTATAGLQRVDLTAYGDVGLEIDGRLLAALPALDATATRVEYLQLEKGYHSLRLELENPFPGGGLTCTFGSGEEGRVRFAADLGGPETSAGEYLAWDPRSNLLPTAGRLAALSRWLRGVSLSTAEGRIEAEVSRQRGDFPPEASPYLVFLGRNLGRLRDLSGMWQAAPDPAVAGDVIIRASGEEGLLFFTPERWPGYPLLFPSVLFQLDFPRRPPLVFPAAFKLSIQGNRPRILPLGMRIGSPVLRYSTAQPLAVFEDDENHYLVGIGESGETVEYGFDSESVAKVETRPWMRQGDVKSTSRIILAPADGRGHFQVGPKEGKPLIVKTITFRDAEECWVWESGKATLLFRSDLRVLAQERDDITVQIPCGGYSRMRIFPGARVAAIVSDQERFEAQHHDDWAEIRFIPSLPLIAAKKVADDRLVLLTPGSVPDAKDVYLSVRFEGRSAQAFAGERIIAQGEADGDPWRFSILNALAAGTREIRFEFEPPGGRILSANVEPVVEKVLNIELKENDTN